MDEKNNIQAALDAGQVIGKPINWDPAKPDSPFQVVVAPAGCSVFPVEPHISQFRAAPLRTKACPKFETLDSLIEYVLGFKNDDSKIFVSAGQNKAPTVLAILDYHTADSPQWGDHKALYVSQFSVEWLRWTGKNAVKMSQSEFATLLEENASLIVDPPGAELLELVTTLEGHADIQCNQLVRLNNGRVKLVYDENVTLTGQVTSQPNAMEFPKALKVQIAPFDGGPVYPVSCRLRYRIENRRLTFWFECVDIHLVVKDCVDGMVERIGERLTITPLMGSPS